MASPPVPSARPTQEGVPWPTLRAACLGAALAGGSRSPEAARRAGRGGAGRGAGRAAVAPGMLRRGGCQRAAGAGPRPAGAVAAAPGSMRELIGKSRRLSPLLTPALHLARSHGLSPSPPRSTSTSPAGRCSRPSLPQAWGTSAPRAEPAAAPSAVASEGGGRPLRQEHESPPLRCPAPERGARTPSREGRAGVGVRVFPRRGEGPQGGGRRAPLGVFPATVRGQPPTSPACAPRLGGHLHPGN